MASTLVKGGMAAAGVGSAGLGGWAVSSHINSKSDTVKTVLLSKKYQLTSSLESGEQEKAWQKVLKTYKLEAKGDLKIKEGDVSTYSEIKDWCFANLESPYKESIFKKAKKWCVVYSTFEDKLKVDGSTLETEASVLNGKYSSLGELKGEVDSISISTSGNNANGEKLKQWCTSKSDSSYSDDSNDLYQKFKTHCTKAAAQTSDAAPRQ
ncbi:hypothetical protein HF1_05460 [Mycoplasma haemofelis str. Langford 1]|uniref:Uncharacterized protein n=1 Tax=Mycoplasma haemofelis (strain Langford 1) TaxID=941640 RepID=E8ZHD3_MYCHL|nr:hypothetical protein [Mycoplasma haemofelis]CBY92554.1 hypothetical protein HF1_05460 [Mycoplasma haemofelis str. Langford 1]